LIFISTSHLVEGVNVGSPNLEHFRSHFQTNCQVDNFQVSVLYHFTTEPYKYHLTIASIGKAFNFLAIVVFSFNSSGKSFGQVGFSTH